MLSHSNSTDESLHMPPFASKLGSRANLEEMFLAPELDVMASMQEEERRPPLNIIWRNVVIFTLLHLYALLGLYQFLYEATWMTVAWAVLLHFGGIMGVTAGAHRLWSHRSFTAATPVRVYFMLWSTVAFQNDVIEWVRDHRCHHKWTDTEADPHNSSRGFWYSHIGWLCSRKSDKLKEMGKKIDLSDVLADPVLAFQRRHYYSLVALLCFLLPTAIPVFLWGESALVAFNVAAVFRYAFTLNSTWLINSAAHAFGYRPYDATISPVESTWTNLQAVGEGGHNFHHSFPQDYRASEFSYATNWTRAVIDALAYFDLVHDRKTASAESIRSLSTNKGDGSGDGHH